MKIILMLSILFCFISMPYAQAEQKQEPTVEVKQVQGQVSSLRPKNDPRFIGIIYSQDEEKGADYEIILPISKDTSVTHKNNLSEIGIGDTVSVTYETVTEVVEGGEKHSENIVKDIQFVSVADEATLEKFGLIEDPVEKFRKEKMEEFRKTGEWPIKSTAAATEEFQKKKIKEWEAKGEWPIKGKDKKVLRSED